MYISVAELLDLLIDVLLVSVSGVQNLLADKFLLNKFKENKAEKNAWNFISALVRKKPHFRIVATFEYVVFRNRVATPSLSRLDYISYNYTTKKYVVGHDTFAKFSCIQNRMECTGISEIIHWIPLSFLINNLSDILRFCRFHIFYNCVSCAVHTYQIMILRLLFEIIGCSMLCLHIIKIVNPQ